MNNSKITFNQKLRQKEIHLFQKGNAVIEELKMKKMYNS